MEPRPLHPSPRLTSDPSSTDLTATKAYTDFPVPSRQAQTQERPEYLGGAVGSLSSAPLCCSPNPLLSHNGWSVRVRLGGMGLLA